ncbi:DUF72 domain-containing protein [Pseudoxanthomonas winnipegensis]|uniref:DUF72 domain-containing protein n=1 Tax=Pseudoxanthomonas winnipegensis TaxID=2480810 RepID=UPI0025790125|nr:DUF72 domain-containing protein [Pseudoxanthomonas winnipegensis]WJI16789.1 DUF72 domain-containing protein [Pseudoxanthomonas winnipegensis]
MAKRSAAAPDADLFQTPAAPEGIRVGIGGWVYAPWRDNFYPAGLVQRLELEYASARLTAIEINGTYYGTQQPATYAKWRDATPEGFMFSAKAPKRITQSRKLTGTRAQVEDFIGGISELGDKLGPLVWQFEAGRRIDAEQFEGFLDLLPKKAGKRTLRHVLDVRDPDFITPDFLALVRAHGMGTVFSESTEYLSFADITGDFVYARLMASRSDEATGYPAAELDAWARRARAWRAGEDPEELPHVGPTPAPKRPREVFVFFISAAKERNPAAAMALLERLRK